MDKLKADGGTFTQAALESAAQLFTERPDGEMVDNKIIILLTDGEPTFSYKFVTVHHDTEYDFEKAGGSVLYVNPDITHYYDKTDKVLKQGSMENHDNYMVSRDANLNYDFKQVVLVPYINPAITHYYKDGKFIPGSSFWHGNYSVPKIKDAYDEVVRRIDTTSELSVHETRAIEQAKTIKDTGAIIYTVGVKAEKAESGLRTMASSNSNYFPVKDSSNLIKLLNKLSFNIKKSVCSATITDSMGQYVNFVPDSVEVTASSDDIKNFVTDEFSTGTLSIAGLNVGLNEWINIRYQLKIAAGAPMNQFFATSEKTTLKPTSSSNSRLLDFKIPQVRYPSINVNVEKKWIGDGLDDVIFKIAPGGTELKVSKNLQGEWKGSFTGLRKYDMITGQEIQYQVTEIVPAEYTLNKKEGNHKTGYVFTNTSNHILNDKISIHVKKKWIGESADSVSFTAQPGNHKLILPKEGKWEGSFNGLPKYDPETANEIHYIVTEDSLEGYTLTDCKGDYQNGYEFTNTKSDLLSDRDIVVNKLWRGDLSEGITTTPAITIQLYKDGILDKTQELKSGENTYTWYGVKKFDGVREIKYVVDELPVSGYIKESIDGNMKDGFTITNRSLYTKPGNFNFANTDYFTGQPLSGARFALYEQAPIILKIGS